MRRIGGPARAAVSVSILIAVTACNSGTDVSPPVSGPVTTSEPGGSVASSADDDTLALVHGSATCQLVSSSERRDGGNDVVLEHFRCAYETNDPRVNGDAEGDFTTTFEPAEATSARWEATFTITNEGGSWSGTYRGSLVFWSVAGVPYNYGECIFTGSGGYEGLTYHELGAGGNAKLVVAGWIEPAG